jgi:hypothetical protein
MIQKDFSLTFFGIRLPEYQARLMGVLHTYQVFFTKTSGSRAEIKTTYLQGD